ncbi:MAG: ABC transporter permease/M1 family aminopeptidase [Candidatus Kapaibacteriota bacterium]
MFAEFFRYEIRYNLARPVTWVYFGMMVLFGVMITSFAGGGFADINVSIGGMNSGGIVYVNAATPIAFATILVTSIFGMSIVSSLFSTSVQRDFENNTHSLFYTSPISKTGYLGGRFAAVVLIVLVIMSGCSLGLMLPTFIPNFLKPEKVGPFNLAFYLHPLFLFTLPNILFAGGLFFMVSSLTRKANAANYLATFLLLGYLLASNLVRDLENETVAALLDPFGLITYGIATRYWTAVERNTTLLQLAGTVLANRAIWLAAGVAFAAFAYNRFKFQHVVPEKHKKAESDAMPEGSTFTLALPSATRDFSSASIWRVFATFVKVYVRGIVREKSFLGIILGMTVFLIILLRNVGSIYGTETYPVTYNVLEILIGSLSLYLLYIITYYAGDLVFHEREMKVDAITDTLPVPTWVLFVAKLAALALVIAMFCAALIPIGMITQVSNGYTNFEVGLYVKEIFGLRYLEFVMIAALALFVHTVANNKYVGYIVIGIYYMAMSFGSRLGIEHNLWKYGSDPGITYSDMNEYGHFLAPFFWYKLYWGACALILTATTYLLWVRGTESDWTTRLSLLKSRFTSRTGAFIGASALLFGSTGGWIFYNNNILNTYRTEKETTLLQVDYEKNFKKYERLVQPKITDVRVEADIFPAERNMVVRGRYILENKSQSAIQEIHVNTPNEYKSREMTLAFSRPATVKLADKRLGYYIYTLAAPLQPKDTLTLNFVSSVQSRGFSESESGSENIRIAKNGTFVSNDNYLPSLGYEPAGEMTDKDERKKYGLPTRPEGLPPASSAFHRQRNLFNRDADWVSFEATLSTSPDQIAIAPGYLQKTWEQNGRKYFRYTMDSKMANFFALISGRYEIKRDVWFDSLQNRPVNIEVFYHKAHEYNVLTMIDATKKSLAYYTKNFGPYQHKQLRIIEFPRFASFAQSFPNTVPYSESIGFIARVKDEEEDINYPFYVTAHEVAHQWWGHQVIGGFVEGSQVMSETMAQYSALMVMEKEYGKEKMRRFLKYELDDYLSGRGFATQERPLAKIALGDQHIHYNKGSLVMYSLRDYIGEDRLNAALKGYVEKVRFQESPFTTCEEFVAALRPAVPDSLQYLITDLFETITLYNNRALKAVAKPEANGMYALKLTLDCQKVRADSVGNEKDALLNDWVDIGVFGKTKGASGKERDTLLLMERHQIKRGEQTLTLLVRGEPKKAGIDPQSKLLDRKPSDNLKDVEIQR